MKMRYYKILRCHVWAADVVMTRHGGGRKAMTRAVCTRKRPDSRSTPRMLTWKRVSYCLRTSEDSVRFLVRRHSRSEGVGIRTGSSSGLAAWASCGHH